MVRTKKGVSLQDYDAFEVTPVENATGAIRVLDNEPRGSVFEFQWPKRWRREAQMSSLPPIKK